MKRRKPRLDNDSDPKRKLGLGLLALACVLALSVALDAATDALLPDGEATEEEAAEEEEEEVAEEEEEEDEQTEEEATEGEDSSGEDVAAQTIGDWSIAEGAAYLASLDEEEIESLAVYVDAWCASMGFGPEWSALSVLGVEGGDDGLTVYLSVVELGATLECVYDPTLGSWDVGLLEEEE